jgi:PEGA domain
MSRTLLRMSLVIMLSVANLRGAGGPESGVPTKEGNVRIVEDRTVVETRRVYESQVPNRQRRAAIFVNNNAGASLNDKVPVLESQLASRLASSDFTVVSRDDVQKALKVYPTGASVQQPSRDLTATDQNLVADRNTLGTRTDRLLSDNSSALRLAQNLGVDFLVIATINSFDANETKFKDETVEFTTVEYVLQVTYKVLEGVTGGAIGGDDFECTKKFKITPSLRRNDGNLFNELLRTAAGKISQSFVDKASAFKASTAPSKVEIAIACTLRDLQGNELSLPDIGVTENNEFIKGDKITPVQASATVEVDGIAMGTTPSQFKLAPGLHKLRLTREGCTDYEATISAEEGLKLKPTLQLSEAGLQRWMEIRAFLNELDTKRKLTDAQVKVLEGYAQFLRQSRHSINVDTKEGMKFYLNKSLY